MKNSACSCSEWFWLWTNIWIFFFFFSCCGFSGSSTRVSVGTVLQWLCSGAHRLLRCCGSARRTGTRRPTLHSEQCSQPPAICQVLSEHIHLQFKRLHDLVILSIFVMCLCKKKKKLSQPLCLSVYLYTHLYTYMFIMCLYVYVCTYILRLGNLTSYYRVAHRQLFNCTITQFLLLLPSAADR